jgi:hypothetical protein
MIVSSAKIAALNSLLFIRDANIREVPNIDGKSAVWSTASCVAVSCRPDCDGETEVIIGAPGGISARGSLLFDGKMKTPSRRVVVETVLRERILESAVPNAETRVRIWTNGRPDTDRVSIGLD